MDPWQFIASLAPEITPWGALLVVVLLIATGKLVPRSTLRDVRDDRKERVAEIVAERDDWKAAYTNSEGARHVQDATIARLSDSVDDLTEVGHATNSLIKSLKPSS